MWKISSRIFKISKMICMFGSVVSLQKHDNIYIVGLCVNEARDACFLEATIKISKDNFC